MSWSLLLPAVTLVVMLGLWASFSLGSFRKEAADPEVRATQLYDEVLRLVKESYVRDVDVEELTYDALRHVIGGLDPYSRFYGPVETERFREETSGQYEGVGFVVDTQADPITVLYPFRESPAQRAGLRPGDRVISIDGQPVEGMTHDDAVSRIRGRPGTTVTLEIERADTKETFTVSLDRQPIVFSSVARARMLFPDEGIATIRVASFLPTTVEEFDKAMARLEEEGEVRGLILDLRFNGGGPLDSAVELANRFLPAEGPGGEKVLIVSVGGRDPRHFEAHWALPEACWYPELPLVVLTNEDSASASEVLAGALQDHRRALIVGTPTWGKGVVQQPFFIGNRRLVTLKLTIAAYYTPAGRCIEKRVGMGEESRPGGLTPDVLVPLPKGHRGLLLEEFKKDEIPEDHREAVERWMGRNGEPGEAGAPRPGATLDDTQLAAAVQLLRGEPVYSRIPREAEPREEAGDE